MHALEHNIKNLNLRIEAACRAYNRPCEQVKLLAVSKTQTAAALQTAYQLGLTSFGENYASEAMEKIPQLAETICWHFIGPIQSNKSRAIAENFSWVHSLDRIKIAQRLSSQRPAHLAPLQCLIQVNISNEPQKAGIAANEVLAFAAQLQQLPHLQLRGLMAIPKAEQSPENLEKDFANMGALLRQLQAEYKSADCLSMGMSADFELAIKHGATLIRIGSDLFGARAAKPSSKL